MYIYNILDDAFFLYVYNCAVMWNEEL
jgi:hypothetical protein